MISYYIFDRLDLSIILPGEKKEIDELYLKGKKAKLTMEHFSCSYTQRIDAAPSLNDRYL